MQSESGMPEVRARLATARAVTVLTGAGISADSGVPTFRGADGLWRNFRAEDLATPEAFARDPRLVWEWYNWRRELIATKKPNPAHYAVADLERRLERCWLITQNVDGLHRTAGSQKLSEIHGNIWKVRCTRCSRVDENREVPIAILPSCAACGGLLRPHIVWFGESLASEDLDRSYEALGRCEVLLIIGTSGEQGQPPAVRNTPGATAPAASPGAAPVVEIKMIPTIRFDKDELMVQQGEVTVRVDNADGRTSRKTGC